MPGLAFSIYRGQIQPDCQGSIPGPEFAINSYMSGCMWLKAHPPGSGIVWMENPKPDENGITWNPFQSLPHILKPGLDVRGEVFFEDVSAAIYNTRDFGTLEIIGL